MTTRFDRAMGPLLLVTGTIGLIAAFELAVEKFRVLDNPFYVPRCSFSETVSCGAVMTSDQAEAFGFPNPLLGILGFSVLAATGLAIVGGAKLARWYWLGLQAGLLLAVIFVHWLAFQTLYRIGAVCPYCLAVWAMTIPAFWYVTLHNATFLPDSAARVRDWSAVVARNHAIPLTLWMLAITALVFERFWAPWESVLA